MSSPSVSRASDGDYTHVLDNGVVESALKNAGELPNLYDSIYVDFPKACNANEGHLGRLTAVKMARDMKSDP